MKIHALHDKFELIFCIWSATNPEIEIVTTNTVIIYIVGGGPRDVMVKVMDSGMVVSKFKLQSRYYVHFWTNTLRKGMNSLTLPAMG